MGGLDKSTHGDVVFGVRRGGFSVADFALRRFDLYKKKGWTSAPNLLPLVTRIYGKAAMSSAPESRDSGGGSL